MHIALGGCLKAPPIRYGLTSDTGGHIAYVLGAAAAQRQIMGVERVTIVTRLFEDEMLGPVYAAPVERVTDKLSIVRLRGDRSAYLEKDDLTGELPALTAAFLAMLARSDARPDVIHAHFADAAGMAGAARARFGIPFVYTPHALGIDKQLAEPASPGLAGRIGAERLALTDADAIIVSSRDEAERQVAGYGVAAADRISVIAPGTPAHVATSGRPRAGLFDDLVDPAKPIILAIARPVRKKNLVALVRAYRANAALMARANLVILAGQHGCGRSSAEEMAVVAEMRRMGVEPDLRGRFALPDSHEAEDIAALYTKAADGGVFVNPALHEPFGLTLIEAAAAGVPVVATRNGGAADIVAATGHGLLVDPEDIAGIGAACLAIIDDGALHQRFSEAGRAGSRRYSWNRYAARSVTVYEELRAPVPRVLACDIDGTLTGCAVGAAAFGRWHLAGILPFVIATGRSLESARDVLRTWMLPEPSLFITDVGTRIHRRAADGRWQACAAYADYLDADWDRDAVIGCLDTLELIAQAPETAGPHKISFFGRAGEAEAIRATLAQAGLPARVIFSHGRFIDVLAPRAGKAAALAFYMREQGLSLRHAIACGDSGNDRDMLEAAGRAIVVGNADADLADLPTRPGLIRTTAYSASGIMEGLDRIGLVAPSIRAAA